MKLFPFLFLPVFIMTLFVFNSSSVYSKRDCAREFPLAETQNTPEYRACLAQNQLENEGVCNPVIPALCGIGNIGSLFGALVSGLFALLLIVGALFTFINLLQGGFLWISSGGDKANIDAARSRIMNALLGLFITASTWVIFMLVTQFLGITSVGSSSFQLPLPQLFPTPSQ